MNHSITRGLIAAISSQKAQLTAHKATVKALFFAFAESGKLEDEVAYRVAVQQNKQLKADIKQCEAQLERYREEKAAAHAAM